MYGIKEWWSQSPGGTKLLVVGMIALTLAVSVLVARRLAAPGMEPLFDQPLDAPHRSRITTYLQGEGVPYDTQGGRIRVPPEDRPRVLAALRVHELLPRDSTPGAGFAALTTHKPAWYLSNEQNRQVYNLALQDELSRVVAGYPGVKRATVIVSQPQAVGFAATHRRPSASVSVEMSAGAGALDARTVDAIAALISGSVSEMRPQDVAVIDATAGRQFKARASHSASTGIGQELQHGLEQAYREKIIGALSYIEGVIVAVNVEVDVVRRQTDSQTVDPMRTFELRLSERTLESNADSEDRALIWRRESPRSVERQFQPAISQRHETAVDPGGLPTRVSATVNVPRSFLAHGDADDIQEQLARIRRQIEPLVLSREPGQVVVDIYPDARRAAGAVAPAAATPSAAGLSETTWFDPWPIAVGLLAISLLVLGLRRPAAPSAQQAVESTGPAPWANHEHLLACVRGEQPQTIAVILSRLSDEKAAEVLIELPEAVQAEVVQRMAEMEEAAPDVLREVDDYLAGRLAETSPPADFQSEIVHDSPLDPDLLDSLDDTTVRAVLDELGREDLVLAMRVAGDRFRRTVLRCVPRDEARRIRQELEAMTSGGVRICDIEAAQRRVLELASRYQSTAMAA